MPIRRGGVKSYIFKAVVEPDDDRWSAYCPALLKQGAATWGSTQEEALKNLQEVVQMVVESLIKHGEPVPEGPGDEVQVSEEPYHSSATDSSSIASQALTSTTVTPMAVG
jgi:predicted RNase H-like HicB family nuclease